MIDKETKLFKRFYSDNKYRNSSYFFSMIRHDCHSESRILNLGAGPGTGIVMRSFKGKVGEVVGADIDQDVLTNTELDKAVVIKDGKLPFENESFDVIYSDYVVEHVEHPLAFLSEIYRCLKPGSSYYFRTPNIYHYVSIIARITPHWFHEAVANRVRGFAQEAHDPYPTFYRLNSRRKIQKLSATIGFQKVSLEMKEGKPSYLMFHTLPFLLGVAYERIVNSTEILGFLRENIFGKITK